MRTGKGGGHDHALTAGDFELEVLVHTEPAVRIEVPDPGRVRVTAPPRTDIAGVIARHQRWIRRRLHLLAEVVREHGDCEDLFLINGIYCHLSPGERCSIDTCAGEATYTTPAAWKRFLSGYLREDLRMRADTKAAVMGVTYRRIAIRMQKTRWASCSGTGTLSFNLRLAAVPEGLRDYLVVHELAHRLVPAHDLAFWETVAVFCPEYREAEAALKQYWLAIRRNRFWQHLDTL
jgi:predicted metal-dependent hydrolase